jgi:competence ComEA-like helix-hairpin-helix protein
MQDKHAVLLLISLAVAGHGVRLLLSRPGDPPGQVLAAPGPRADPMAQRDRAIRLSRPLAPGETVDLNLASAEEIARLPRIGMSLAKRILADRVARGPYQSLGDLERVAGVGPALIDQLRGRVRFGGIIGAVRPPPAGNPTRTGSSSYDARRGPLNLNSADSLELVALPGIGPARARAILAYRREKGSFASVAELRAVPGLTRRLVERLAPIVTVR